MSNDVKLFMILPTRNRYYALNDRTINLLMKGKIDMNAVTEPSAGSPTFSDAEIGSLLEQETEVLITVGKNEENKKTRAGGAFFKYLNLTNLDLPKYGLFKNIDRNNYKHNCLFLALEAGGVSDVKSQQLILTLRNRTIHKCDLSNVCNVLEINIELISPRDDNEKCRVEHYPQCPSVEYDENIK